MGLVVFLEWKKNPHKIKISNINVFTLLSITTLQTKYIDSVNMTGVVNISKDGTVNRESSRPCRSINHP